MSPPMATIAEALYVPASLRLVANRFCRGTGRCREKRLERVFHQFLHWFFHDLTPWITGIAQAHPIWCFPIAFLVAFSESFVGVSFIIPGTFLLISLGVVIGASDISV